jgi:glycosyltransferase involved in cell wall biosynthesis
VPALLDVCEARSDPGGEVARVSQEARLRLLYSLFDGVVAISDLLRADVRSLSGPSLSVMKMGVLMDAEPFARRAQRAEPRTIVFAGYLNEPKDGVGSLISAFAALPPEDVDVRLVLVGQETEAGDEAAFRRQAQELGVARRVDFTGRLDREELIPVMARATVLALARPSSVQAEAGFPTKLSEYLATGNPVVVTATGEIPRFLHDRHDAYVVPPGDHDALVAALHEALSANGEGRAVGARGREVALRRFDYRANAARFDAFVTMLEDLR